LHLSQTMLTKLSHSNTKISLCKCNKKRQGESLACINLVIKCLRCKLSFLHLKTFENYGVNDLPDLHSPSSCWRGLHSVLFGYGLFTLFLGCSSLHFLAFHKLDHGHRCCITGPVTGGYNSRIPSVSRGEPRRYLHKQVTYD